MWRGHTEKGGQGGIPTCKFKNVTAILESCHTIHPALLRITIKFEGRKLECRFNYEGWIVQI